MSTNYYYYQETDCEKCQRNDEPTHIGKASNSFTFHGTDKIRSYRDWQAVWASGGMIKDEYKTEISVADLRDRIETCLMNPNEANLSAHQAIASQVYGKDYWLDEDGLFFVSGEFC